MKVSLSFEKGYSKDISIMVDALRASSTITIALDKFKEIYPVYTPEEAIEIAETKDAVLAGERTGRTIEGFELGNSPGEMKEYNGEKESLVLTTTNGVRTLDNMEAETILIGSFINAKACAKAACKLAREHIEIVMGGFERTFAIEDFLAAGEILFWIQKELDEQEKLNIDDIDYFKEETGITEFAISAIMASRDKEKVEKVSIKSKSGRRLAYLGYEDDVNLCVKENISENVGIYRDGKITLYHE